MQTTFGYEDYDPRYEKFAHHYLESWHDFGEPEALWEAYLIARRLWSISSALQWKHVTSHLPGLRAEMGFAVPALLQEVLETNPEL
jgi:hypothetical protein